MIVWSKRYSPRPAYLHLEKMTPSCPLKNPQMENSRFSLEEDLEFETRNGAARPGDFPEVHPCGEDIDHIPDLMEAGNKSGMEERAPIVPVPVSTGILHARIWGNRRRLRLPVVSIWPVLLVRPLWIRDHTLGRWVIKRESDERVTIDIVSGYYI